VYWQLSDPVYEGGYHNLPRTPAAVLPGTFDGNLAVSTGLLYLNDALDGSYIVNSPGAALTNLGDGVIISKYPDGEAAAALVPER